MALPDLTDRVGPRSLCPARCRALLAGMSWGHLAISQGALPVVVPVTYALEGEDLLFRASRGLVGRAALEHEVVAFGTGALVGDGSWAWEVLVQGRAEPMGPAGCPGHRPPLFPLVGPELTVELRMSMDRLTGWQYGPAEEETKEVAGA